MKIKNVIQYTCVIFILLFYLGNHAKEDDMDKCNYNKKLSVMQHYVTQENGTEPPFKNKYWDNKQAGIYVDVVSGEPLFSSNDKYDSRSGWPSFSKPLAKETIVEKVDRSHGMERVEVRSKEADSHLGHVFTDGPKPSGLRYCINSASLRFVPVEDLEKEGYGEYAYLFEKSDTMAKEKERLFDTATFAAGCFWGVEDVFNSVKGVIEMDVGYTGGHTENPSYKQVCTGSTGHAEAVRIVYNPDVIVYDKLLDYFWRLHNPTTLNRQGPDIGSQYRSAIFYHNDNQKKIAEESKKKFDLSGFYKKKAVTEIVPATDFYVAEEYHQDYFKKNGVTGCHILREK